MKLTMHTILCLALVIIFAYRAYDMRLRGWKDKAFLLTVFIMLTAAYMGIAPWVYRLNTSFFWRMTIHPAQLLFLTATVLYFGPSRETKAPVDEVTDFSKLLDTEVEERSHLH